jgi:hypothetical protein
MAKQGKGGAGRAAGNKKSPKVRADALLVERGLAAVGDGKVSLQTREPCCGGLIEGLFHPCQHANEALALILKRAVVADEGKIIVDKVLARSPCTPPVAPLPPWHGSNPSLASSLLPHERAPAYQMPIFPPQPSLLSTKHYTPQASILLPHDVPLRIKGRSSSTTVSGGAATVVPPASPPRPPDAEGFVLGVSARQYRS